MTSTIEVANGMNASGNAVRSARNSIAAIAVAPPAAPARMAIHGRSFFMGVSVLSQRVTAERIAEIARPNAYRDAQILCIAQIFVDSFINQSRNGAGRSRNRDSSMRYKGVAPSHLPSFLLPCPHCGHRMAITSVAPARYDNGAESNDLEDVTHGCVHCGTTLISTRRSLSDDAYAIAHRV